nr:MAG TPA: hypothetical protein [Caudoviricetes sp.]
MLLNNSIFQSHTGATLPRHHHYKTINHICQGVEKHEH